VKGLPPDAPISLFLTDYEDGPVLKRKNPNTQRTMDSPDEVEDEVDEQGKNITSKFNKHRLRKEALGLGDIPLGSQPSASPRFNEAGENITRKDTIKLLHKKAFGMQISAVPGNEGAIAGQSEHSEENREVSFHTGFGGPSVIDVEEDKPGPNIERKSCGEPINNERDNESLNFFDLLGFKNIDKSASNKRVLTKMSTEIKELLKLSKALRSFGHNKQADQILKIANVRRDFPENDDKDNYRGHYWFAQDAEGALHYIYISAEGAANDGKVMYQKMTPGECTGYESGQSESPASDVTCANTLTSISGYTDYDKATVEGWASAVSSGASGGFIHMGPTGGNRGGAFFSWRKTPSGFFSDTRTSAVYDHEGIPDNQRYWHSSPSAPASDAGSAPASDAGTAPASDAGSAPALTVNQQYSSTAVGPSTDGGYTQYYRGVPADDVRALQRAIGITGDDVDGAFGDNTKATYLAFVGQKGWSNTDMPATWGEAINQVNTQRQATPEEPPQTQVSNQILQAYLIMPLSAEQARGYPGRRSLAEPLGRSADATGRVSSETAAILVGDQQTGRPLVLRAFNVDKRNNPNLERTLALRALLRPQGGDGTSAAQSGQSGQSGYGGYTPITSWEPSPSVNGTWVQLATDPMGNTVGLFSLDPQGRQRGLVSQRSQAIGGAPDYITRNEQQVLTDLTGWGNNVRDFFRRMSPNFDREDAQNNRDRRTQLRDARSDIGKTRRRRRRNRDR